MYGHRKGGKSRVIRLRLFDRKRLREKAKESIKSVTPIMFIVTTLCLSVAPVANDQMVSFLLGGLAVIVGLGLFNFGAENSMTEIGSLIGSRITKSLKLWLVLLVSFLLGVIITIAEPDLTVLAGNVPHINSLVLILTISVGVGFFLLVGMLRILMGVPIHWILMGSYALVFLLAAFSDPDYLSVAFDAGGVTTGPMTAPFILALGAGVAAIRSDRNAEADSFGLVAVCSVGPILMVLALGFFYPGESGVIAAEATRSYANTVEVGMGFGAAFPQYMKEVAAALLPVLAFFLIFQVFLLKLGLRTLARILVGLVFTYVGLVLFLAGANVGFSSLAVLLGNTLGNGATRAALVPVGFLLGWFIVRAEPAVHSLTQQVEDVSAGAVSAKIMRTSLSFAIGGAAALSILRSMLGIHIFWFLIPGYAVSLALAFFVPPIYTAIAFDAGGVASGPMCTTFLLPLAIGVCQASGGSVLTDAFGCVALVAMMPLLTVQIMGLVGRLKARRHAAVEPVFGDSEIIELWEVN